MRSSKPELNPQLSPAGAIAPAPKQKQFKPFDVKVGEHPLEFHRTLEIKGLGTFPVRAVAWPYANPQSSVNRFQLVADEAGNYYAIEYLAGKDRTMKDWRNGNRAQIVKALTGREALHWIVRAFVDETDDHIYEELHRAIRQPEFEFMPLVATGKRKTRPRRGHEPAPGPYEVQLEMATALVECVRKLNDAPSIENLANACRDASAVHQAIHAPENFKKAGAL